MMKENKNFDTNISIKNTKGIAPKIDTQKADFSVVGIGASAGGLEALLTFLDNVPENSKLAFVIVQHMEKSSKDILVELLQNNTSMKVQQANDNMSIQPNCVYVIPPNKNISIKNNLLYIFDFIENNNPHLPIDFFFSSLAKDKREKSVGIILSGMGKDGTEGLREIKKNGGGVFIQEPSTAKFKDMPLSAIGRFSGCYF